MDELRADVKTGSLELFDDFREVDKVEFRCLIENVEGADDSETALLGNVPAVSLVDEEPVSLEFFSEGDGSGFARVKVR